MASEVGFAKLTEHLSHMEKALSGQALREITSHVALDAKKDTIGELVQDLGGDKKFTNWKPRLGAGYELESDSVAVITPRPQGPWKVLDHGRWPGHKYSRKAHRNVGWGPTRGKGTWDRAVKDIEERTPARVHREVKKMLEEIFT